MVESNTQKGMRMAMTTKPHDPLNATLMVQLAAPHTWPASIFPVLVASALAVAHGEQPSAGFVIGGQSGAFSIDPITVCVLLAICVLLQSSVNTLNDYFDYEKGTDTKENQDDPTDAVLVYNNLDPKHVLAFAAVLIAGAFLLGIYAIYLAGWIPLVIALAGVAVIYCYSGGRTPISYLPLGELVSGFTMGGLIPLSCYQVLTLDFNLFVLVLSMPLIIGIALIMATNNICDIDKDRAARRKTLPVLVGHDRAQKIYRALVYAWVVSICIIVVVFFTRGWFVLPFMLLAVHSPSRALIANPLLPQTRRAAFGQVTSLNIILGTFFAAAIFASVVS